MSIEQKLLEIQALAEQLAEAKCMKKEAEEETEDEPEGKDGESDIENDDEAEDSEDDEKNEGVLSSIAAGAGKMASAVGGNPVQKWAKSKAKQMAKDDASNQARSGKINMGQLLAKHKEIDNDPQYKTESEDKIDLGDLFAGQELSEEFKGKAAAVFEAAVAVRVQQEVAELQESLAQQQLDEAVELKESLVDKVDGYLDYMVEQWMQKNELAINRGVKTEILESFVSGMKSLFETHYIDVPDEKYDLVEESQAEVQALEARLDEAAEQLVGMQQQIREMVRQRSVDEACAELAATDAERFRQLAEGLAFGGETEFKGKLQSILESYFKSTPSTKVISEEFMTDAPVESINESAAPAVNPTMAAYLRALEKSGF